MIDRYDAPEGMVAVREQFRYACIGCSFNTGRRDCDYDSICPAEEREDETDVIFVTRADFEEMLKQEIAQFYGVKKDDVVIWIRHKDKHCCFHRALC